MTRTMTWIGFLATLLIAIVLGTTALREPKRQLEAAQLLRHEAITTGTDHYAANCAVCHGAAGEGLGAYPALNSEGVLGMDRTDLFHTIARGRYSTAMAAYSTAEGGIFTNAEVDSLVTLIQYADWTQVAARVDALGLTPPPLEIVEVPDEVLVLVNALPDGTTLTSGLTLFAENCAACHSSSGAGSDLAPALNTAELRTRLTDAELARLITQGIPGTLMASWDAALTAQDVTALVTLLRRWPEIDAAGISLPVIEAPTIDHSPEAVAAGERLFSILCVQCHGQAGYGSPLAPALNNQTFLGQTPDAAIQQIIAQGVTGTTMPAWGGRLTEADIAALTAYLRSLEPTAQVIAPGQ